MSGTPRPVVVLFDVDETLVHTGGSGTHSSAGETDPQVARATFKGVLGRDPSDEELDLLYGQYLRHPAEDIYVSDGYRMLLGADQCLLALGDAGVLLVIVFGAMEGAARTKLMPANLNRFFIFGSYGSDSPDRTELTALAMEKATRLHRGLTPGQVFVVGDTPHDVEATRGAGAVSVGVASGNFSVAELTGAGADYVLASCDD